MVVKQESQRGLHQGAFHKIEGFVIHHNSYVRRCFTVLRFWAQIVVKRAFSWYQTIDLVTRNNRLITRRLYLNFFNQCRNTWSTFDVTIHFNLLMANSARLSELLNVCIQHWQEIQVSSAGHRPLLAFRWYHSSVSNFVDYLNFEYIALKLINDPTIFIAMIMCLGPGVLSIKEVDVIPRKLHLDTQHVQWVR